MLLLIKASSPEEHYSHVPPHNKDIMCIKGVEVLNLVETQDSLTIIESPQGKSYGTFWNSR
jgi:hypothetical protein